MLLALFCGFFVNLIKKSLTTRFGQDAEVHHHQLQRAHGPDANRAGARTVEIR